jgi:hypothetical protein
MLTSLYENDLFKLLLTVLLDFPVKLIHSGILAETGRALRLYP